MGKTVFLIEDDEDIRVIVEEILTLEGFRVVMASDGMEALDKLAEGLRPDLILLDLMMPRLDGLGFREQSLITYPALASVPVVIMSADGKSDEKMVRANAKAYLRKPMDLEELVKVIKRYV